MVSNTSKVTFLVYFLSDFFVHRLSQTNKMKNTPPTIIVIPSEIAAPSADAKKKRTRSRRSSNNGAKSIYKKDRPDTTIMPLPPNMLRLIPGPTHLMETDISSTPKIMFSRTEHEYLQAQSPEVRDNIIETMKSLKENATVPRRIRVAMSQLPNKTEIMRKLESCDSGKYENWIEYALSIPLGKYSTPPIKCDSSYEDVEPFLKQTRKIMDDCLYGQDEAKDEVVRVMCQWVKSGSVHSFTLGLEGAPGIGKTTFAKSLQRAIDRPFVFIGLGGSCDSAHLVGHSYTYEGAVAGRIADAVKEAKCMDPIICIDELDKISKTHKGDEIVNTLLHLIDKEQNSHFRDRYLGFDLDLSKAIFIFSYNDSKEVNPILLDRLNVVKMKSPSLDDKLDIARIHLIPRSLKLCQIKSDDISFSDELVKYIVESYTNESGVRSLDRSIMKILTTLNVVICGGTSCLSHSDIEAKFPMECSTKMVDNILTRNTEDSKITMMYM